MRFFSWKTLDGGQSISNTHSSRGAFPVVLLVPEKFGGKNLIEKAYDGYGDFDGEDAYALLAEWNAPNKCMGAPRNDRGIGIELGAEDDDMEQLEYPLRFVSLDFYNKANCKYEDFSFCSSNCPHQGYYYIQEVRNK